MNFESVSPNGFLGNRLLFDNSRKYSYTSKMNRISIFLATCGYLGYFPKAPGTAGTALAVLLFYFFHPIYFTPILFLAAVIICDYAEKALHEPDSNKIILDEVVGFYVTMSFIPISPTTLLLGFILFRLFDILKPFPIRYVDRHIKGGLGVVLDDVFAGMFAWGCLYLWTHL